MLHRVPSTSNGGMRSNKNLLGGIKTSMAFSNMDELAEEFNKQQAALNNTSTDLHSRADYLNLTNPSLSKKRAKANRSHLTETLSKGNAPLTRKTLTVLSNNPGPGYYKTSYEVIYKQSAKAVFGHSQRPELTPKFVMNTPGPNNYLPRIDTVKKHHANWTMKQTSRNDSVESLKKRGEVPGPGAYNQVYDASS